MSTSPMGCVDAGGPAVGEVIGELSTGDPAEGTGKGGALRVPGGAASATGAPHCSQKSPSRCSGPLQKRQSTGPGWTADLSIAFCKTSSSKSTMFRPRLARGRSRGTTSRGATIGEGEILKPMLGFGEGSGPAGSNSSAGRADAVKGTPLGAGPAGGGARAASGGAADDWIGELVPVGTAAGSGAPHWRQKRIPSGRTAAHS